MYYEVFITRLYSFSVAPSAEHICNDIISFVGSKHIGKNVYCLLAEQSKPFLGKPRLLG